MRDPLLSRARRRGFGTTANRPTRARMVAGFLVFIALIAATTGGGANAGLLDMLFPTTTRPAPTTTTTTSSTTTSTVAPAGSGGLTLTDTGLTRIRLRIDTQAAWISTRMEGTTIQASKVIETSGGAQIMSLGPTITVKNSGRVVIDFILRIASGANTGLSMCKNYMGPATVTLTRMTNAATTISTVANYGNSGHPPRGQCENQMYRSISRSSFIGPVRWPARQDSRPLVLAHYFPWYDELNLHHNFGPDRPAHPANTNDPTIVAEAVAMAADSGIDAFIVEYEGSPMHNDRIPYVVAAADARDDFKLAFNLDLDVMRWNNGGLSPEILDRGLQAVTAYRSHPSQLLTNGQPVIFLYGGANIPAADWHAGLDRLRVATGVTPYVVADTDTLGAPGIYKFGTYGLMDKQALNSWSSDSLWRYRLEPALEGQPTRVWAAPVSPGYDDRQLNRQPPMYIDRADGQRYEDEWAASLGSLPDWVIVTTWNEYYEQTHVAPGTTTGGHTLAATRRWAAQFHTTG